MKALRRLVRLETGETSSKSSLEKIYAGSVIKGGMLNQHSSSAFEITDIVRAITYKSPFKRYALLLVFNFFIAAKAPVCLLYRILSGVSGFDFGKAFYSL